MPPTPKPTRKKSIKEERTKRITDAAKEGLQAAEKTEQQQMKELMTPVPDATNLVPPPLLSSDAVKNRLQELRKQHDQPAPGSTLAGSVKRGRGRPKKDPNATGTTTTKTTKKAVAQPEPAPQPIPSHMGADRLQTVLNYLLKDSSNLDLIYSIVIRLR